MAASDVRVRVQRTFIHVHSDSEKGQKIRSSSSPPKRMNPEERFEKLYCDDLWNRSLNMLLPTTPEDADSPIGCRVRCPSNVSTFEGSSDESPRDVSPGGYSVQHISSQYSQDSQDLGYVQNGQEPQRIHGEHDFLINWNSPSSRSMRWADQSDDEDQMTKFLWQDSFTSSHVTHGPEMSNDIQSGYASHQGGNAWNMEWTSKRTKDQETSVLQKNEINEELGESDTTVMLCNIACRITHCDVESALDREGFGGLYDYIHVPIAMRTKSNKGYAFINFATADDAVRFKHHFTGYSFPGTKSTKVCTVKPARMQVADANAAQMQVTRQESSRSSAKEITLSTN